MTQTLMAAYLVPGKRFRLHHDGKYYRVVTVQEVPGTGQIRAVFDDPANTVHTFNSWAEQVIFPRRPDGSTIDWRLSDRAPFAWEVYPGDKLRNALEPELPIELTEPQLVTAIHTLVRQAEFDIYDIHTTCASDPGNHRYRFTQNELVTWPREEVQGLDGRRATKSGVLQWHGPYVRSDTGAVFYLAEHPTGRGRWPSYQGHPIQPYPHNADLPHRDEPYRFRFPWHDWDDRLIPGDPALPTGHVRAYRREGVMRWGSESHGEPR